MVMMVMMTIIMVVMVMVIKVMVMVVMMDGMGDSDGCGNENNACLAALTLLPSR